MATIHSTQRFVTLAAVVITAGLFLADGPTAKVSSAYYRPAMAPAPATNQATPARVELGKNLFFDPRLSGSNWISCGTCHNPAMGWSDGLPTAIGHGQQVLGRATPTILNTAFNSLQMWDGRFRSLEEQALGPIGAAGEMNQNVDELVKELQVIPGYVKMFEQAYPGEGVSKETIAKALATYERTVLATEAPFDRWMQGYKNAISASAKRGFEIFEGKAKCSVCHSGYNFNDHGFHNVGVKSTDDEGRFALRKVRVLKGAFKTPTLRDIEKTAPYMHNGAYATLEEVVEQYNGGGDNKANLSPSMAGELNLNPTEKADLVAFLKTLTGKPMNVTIPELPR